MAAETIARHRPGREHRDTTAAIWGPDGNLAATLALGAVPARCPYQAGDWVQLHGYPGAPVGLQRDGFRGFVLGGMGATILRGLTDDGREWFESWGVLVPDGTPSDGRCTCCPRPPIRQGVAAHIQDGLFDGAFLIGATR